MEGSCARLEGGALQGVGVALVGGLKKVQHSLRRGAPAAFSLTEASSCTATTVLETKHCCDVPMLRLAHRVLQCIVQGSSLGISA